MTTRTLRLLLLMLMTARFMTGSAQTAAQADTITVMERINSILVERRGTSTIIRVSDGFDSNYVYKAQVSRDMPYPSAADTSADLESKIAGASDRLVSRRATCSGSSETEYICHADTLLFVTTPSRLTLTESPAGTHVCVTAADGEGANRTELLIPYPEEGTVTVSQSRTSLSDIVCDIWGIPRPKNTEGRDSGWYVSVDGLCVGMVNAGRCGDAVPFRMSKSWELSWLGILNVNYSYRRFRMSLGIGLDWRNFRLSTPDMILTAMPDRGVGTAPWPAGISGDYSRLKIFSLQFPLLAELSAGNRDGGIFKFRFGPIVNLNTHASLNTIGTADNMDVRWSTSDIAPRRLTVDLFGSFSVNHIIGLYVRWSPMQYMHTSSPVNFAPLSAGLTIGV